MMYGLSRNLCQNSAKIVWTVRKYTHKCITAVTSISVPTNVIRQPWNACQYSQKLQLLFLFNFCAHHMLYDLHKSVRYGLFFLAVWNPYFSLLWDEFSPSANAISFLSSTSLLIFSCSLNKNAATFLFLASHQEPLGISPGVSFSLNKISSTSYPRMGAPTCLNQLHEGRWGVF